MDTRFERFGFKAAGLVMGGAVLVGGILAPAPAEARQGASGPERAVVSDVSGTVITTGDMVSGMLMGEPGTVPVLSCGAATGVRDAGLALAWELEARTLTVATPNPGLVPAPDELQDDLLHLLSGDGEAPGAASALAAALTPEDNRAPEARKAAEELAENMAGLLTLSVSLEPEKRDLESAVRLTRATARYNAFIQTSSLEFLERAPLELLAVQATLSRLLVGAMEGEGRPDACGAPPPVAPDPVAEAEVRPPPAPPERAASICLFVDDEGLREVPAIVIPSTGDTLVVADGERRPLREVYATGRYGPGADLVAEDGTVEAMGERYIKFDVPRSVRPGELVRLETYQGANLFGDPDASEPPEVIYVPVERECVVQPFVREDEVRGVHG